MSPLSVMSFLPKRKMSPIFLVRDFRKPTNSEVPERCSSSPSS